MPRKIPLIILLILFSNLATVAYTEYTEQLLQDMTLEQKVAQMFVFTFYGTPLNQPAQAVLETWQPGAVALLPSNLGNPQTVTNLTNQIQGILLNAGGIPALIAVDQEGGIVAHLEDGFTQWPVPMLLTASGDIELAYQVGRSKAAELRAVGINMNLAPVADLHTNPLNPIIGRRSFGSDPTMVAPILKAFVEGMQDGGVLATAKHFPGHGDTDTDSHIALPILNHDRARLQSVELVPFMSAIEANVGAIMMAHIWLPEFESRENYPASLSSVFVDDLLRDQLGYKGLVLTDAMDMDAIDTVYSPEQRALLAIEAGNDLILTGAHVSPEQQVRAMEAVVAAVRAGEIAEERIDQSVQRILDAKATYGVLDWEPLDALTAPQRIDLEAHNQLVQEMFARGITVVRDKQGAIPIQNGTVAFLYPDTRYTIWQSCKGYHDDLMPLGISQTPTMNQIISAQRMAALADTIVIFTINADMNMQQQLLVNMLPPEKTLVVALWSPYDLLAFPDVEGYLVTYSPLLQSHQAVCDILFGEQPSNGTLAVHIGTEIAGQRNLK